MSSFQPYNPDTAVNSAGNDLDPPGDGTHKGCVLRDAAAFTSKSGKDFVKFEWETIDGYTWTVLQGFKSEGQTAVTWSEVAKLGLNPTDIASLDALDAELKQHVGSYYDVAVKTNGQFRNTYINAPSTGSNPVVQQQTAMAQKQAAPVGGGSAEDDDIPF